MQSFCISLNFHLKWVFLFLHYKKARKYAEILVILNHINQLSWKVPKEFYTAFCQNIFDRMSQNAPQTENIEWKKLWFCETAENVYWNVL